MRCKEHPDAPHGFMRDASHSAGRYVCECESWEPSRFRLAVLAYEAGLGEVAGNKFRIENFEGLEKFAELVEEDCGNGLREWARLTDEEIDTAWRSVDYTVPYNQFRIDVARAIEAKLKEKNYD